MSQVIHRILVIVALVVSLISTTHAFAAHGNEKPNIIYILADDLGYSELSCYGQTQYQTPNIDAIAKRGVKFMQHYSGNPVCAPSRCALLTGLHTGHAQIRGNKQIGGAAGWVLGSTESGQYPIEANTVTLTKILQDAGYNTGVIGKWGLGMTHSTGAPNKHGIDHYFGYICQRQAHTHYPNHLWRNDQVVWYPENENERFAKHSHDLMTDEAEWFIDQQQKDDPFFLYLAFAIPHVSIQANAQAMAEFDNKYDETPFPGESMYYPQSKPRAGYAAMIWMLDQAVGRVVAKLEEKGLADNTLIMFTSDNGPTFNGGSDSPFFNSAGPFRGLKGSVYEGGIRVPMIAAWPGRIKPNTVTGHISAFWDVLPTVTEIVGAKTPANIDGISFLPTLLGDRDGQEKHEYLYWELGSKQAIRAGNWKAIRYVDKKANQAGPIELYNLANDPGEIHDVSGQFKKVTKKMEAMFTSVRTESEVFPMFRPQKAGE